MPPLALLWATPPLAALLALLLAALLAGAPATPAEPVAGVASAVAQAAGTATPAPAAPDAAPTLAQPERLAVLELERVGASEEEGAAVTERLRETLLATGRFSLVPRAQLAPALGAQAAGCASTACAVQVARALGVRRIVTGRLARVPPRAWQATAQLLDVDSAETLEVKTLYLEGDLAALLADGVPRLARALAGVAEDGPTLEGSAATAHPPGTGPAPRRQAAPDGAVRVAILPAYLDGEQAEEAARRLPALIARLGLGGEAPRHVVVSHSFYPLGGATAIAARAGLVERTWQGAGPRARPDVAFVQRLGRDLGVDAALLYRLRAERGLGSVQVIVVDVQTGRHVTEEARAPAARLPDVLRDRTRRAVRIYLERFGERSAVR